MTHKDIYEKFMIEYDKANVTSSYPSLTPYEVATILDKAYLALIARKLTGNNTRRVPFEYDVKAIEDLRPLVTSTTVSSTSGTTYSDNEFIFNLPSHMLYYLESLAKYTNDLNPADNKSHLSEIVNLVDHRTALKFRATDVNMPWIKNPVSFLQDDAVHVLIDTYKHHDIPSLLVTYIKSPVSFVAALTGAQDSSSGNNSGDNTGGNSGSGSNSSSDPVVNITFGTVTYNKTDKTATIPYTITFSNVNESVLVVDGYDNGGVLSNERINTLNSLTTPYSNSITIPAGKIAVVGVTTSGFGKVLARKELLTVEVTDENLMEDGWEIAYIEPTCMYLISDSFLTCSTKWKNGTSYKSTSNVTISGAEYEINWNEKPSVKIKNISNDTNVLVTCTSGDNFRNSFNLVVFPKDLFYRLISIRVDCDNSDVGCGVHYKLLRTPVSGKYKGISYLSRSRNLTVSSQTPHLDDVPTASYSDYMKIELRLLELVGEYADQYEIVGWNGTTSKETLVFPSDSTNNLDEIVITVRKKSNS